jgi:hypothetical protein
MVNRPLKPKASNDPDYVPAEPTRRTRKPIPPEILVLETEKVAFEPFEYDKKPGTAKLPDSFSGQDSGIEKRLFELFFDGVVIDRLVFCTNAQAERIRQQPVEKRLAEDTEPVSGRPWWPVTASEIQAYLGLLVYMGLYPLPRLELYWNTKETRPIHQIVRQAMSKTRFDQIQRYFHVWDPDVELDAVLDAASGTKKRKRTTSTKPHPHHKVQKLATLIEDKCKAFWVPGSDLAVDECIARCCGRCSATVMIPGKPTPEGHKIWCLSDQGYIISFCFHVKGSKPEDGPQGITQEVSKHLKFSKTRAVVLDLVARGVQPTIRCCVWLDNLFTSKSLFLELRNRGIGAAGTSRTGKCATSAEKHAKRARNAQEAHEVLTQAPEVPIRILEVRNRVILLFHSQTDCE